MKRHWFALSALVGLILVGLALLALIVVSGARPAVAQARPRKISPAAPFTASDRVYVTPTLEITPVMPFEDVGRYTSGELYPDPQTRQRLGLPEGEWWVERSHDVAKGASSPCVHPLPDDMCVYDGDLHSHTDYSDGEGTPEEAYAMARANGMDFFATTDHAEVLSGSEWNATLAQAQAATVDGCFVALRGFEWTSQYGHANVFATDKRVRATDSHYNSVNEFYAWLSAPEQINSVAQFNHPFYPAVDPFNGWEHDPQADLHVNLIETHNGTVECVDKYDVVLNAGWHVAPASNSDTHWANWGTRRGRTGIIAPALTYNHVINALRARRTFSTEDENLVVAMRADGYWMGSVVRNGPMYFDVYGFDPDDPIATLELYRNGEMFQSTKVQTNTFAWHFSLSEPPLPGTWWYAKAIQVDGEAAYSAPIWADSLEPYDALIRDNMWDTGAVPSVNPSWQSPDIWVRRQADGQIWHQNPVAGETSHVYVRVHNGGSEPLADVYVSIYWADPVLGFSWPENWQQVDATPVRVRRMIPGESAVVSVPWDVPDSTPEHVSLLALLTSTQDPIRYAGRPRWDNNVAWKNVHILDVVEGTILLPPQDITFYLNNPFDEQKAVDIRIFSSDLPTQEVITLSLDTELFERWIVTDTSRLVTGAIVDPISRVIVITSPVDAAVYDLPLWAGENLPTELSLGGAATLPLAIRVSEEIEGEEIGGVLYTTPTSGRPRKIDLEAATSRVSTDGFTGITATVVGEGFVPVVDGVELQFTTTSGSLSTDTMHTQNGLAEVVFRPGITPGTAIVQAGTSGVATTTALVDVCPTCWVRLNDSLTSYPTIQAAVDASTHLTDIVKVAGRCTTTNTLGGSAQVLYISKTVTVRGGYTVTNWTTPDTAANPTTLSAQGQGRGIFVTGEVSPVIEGLRITGGDAEGLGGGPTGQDGGGGIYVVSATVALRNNQVSSNTAEYGGGLYLASGDITLVNNVVTDNRARGSGGGLYVEGSSGRLLHTTIACNGDGIHVSSRGAYPSTIALTNTILVSHTVGITVATGNTATLESTLWGDGGWRNGTDWGGAGAVITGTNNIWGAPEFIEPDAGDYHIGADSGARDTGVDAGVADDVDGESRPMGHGYDIGADELLIDLRVTKYLDAGPVEAGAPITYTIHVTNTGRADLHATVTDTLPVQIVPAEAATGTVIIPGGIITWTPAITAPGGVWTQQVSVTIVLGYAGRLTNLVQVTTAEGATGIYTHTLQLAPGLEIAKRASPNPVRAGAPLIYTFSVTNTGNMNLHVNVTDTLPAHIQPGETIDGRSILPGQVLTWTPVVTAPGGIWQHQIVVTVDVDYVGPLTNVLRAVADEERWCVYTDTATVFVEHRIYLPTLMRGYQPPIPCAPRLIAEIGTGPESYGVALDTAGQRAFVAHAEGVTVIDTRRVAIITTTRSLTLAYGIGYDPDRDRIWVARRDPDRVIVLDGATYATLADLPAGEEPHSVGYDPVNGRVYVTNYQSWTVDVYAAETLTHVVELTGFAEPAHIAINPTTNKIYVANHRPNQGIRVIDGATYDSHQATTTLLDAYGVTVDVSRNLVYATGIAQGRICVIDGATDAEIGHMDIHDDGRAVWLRVITVNPNAGPEGHLLLVTSSHDGERDRVLLIPNGWPTLGTPVPLDIASYPQEGIALEPERDRVWVTSVSSGLVSIIQDGEPVCSPAKLDLPSP